MIKQLFCIFSLCFLVHVVEAKHPCHNVDTRTWEQIQPHLMPKNHPIKKKLDKIVHGSKTPVFYDIDSMTKRGFDFAIPQHKTGIIVTRHPKLKGYVIKAYLDTQHYYDGRPEHYYWVKRVEGSKLIRHSIKKYKFQHLLKVPRKWIYALPDRPSIALPAAYKRKMFILVEEDMNIVDDATNEKYWRSPYATKELLVALHRVITEHGFKDCAKPANCPFSKDGRVALVDTQSFYKKVGYYKLTRYLSPEMQVYWKSLSHVGVKGN